MNLQDLTSKINILEKEDEGLFTFSYYQFDEIKKHNKVIVYEGKIDKIDKKQGLIKLVDHTVIEINKLVSIN